MAAPTLPGLEPLDAGRWLDRRRQVLVLAVLLGCIALAGLIAWLSVQPQLDSRWRHTADGRVEWLGPAVERAPEHLVAIEAAGQILTPPPGLRPLFASTRWAPGDEARRTLLQWNSTLHALLHTPGAVWVLDSGRRVPVVGPPGLRLPTATFWVLAALALALYAIGFVVSLVDLRLQNLLFGVIAVCQAGNLLALGVEQALQWGHPPLWMRLDSALRSGADLLTAAAIVHVACLYPRRQKHTEWLITLVWTIAVLMTAAALTAAGDGRGTLPGGWWWTQLVIAAMGIAALVQLTRSRRAEAHPLLPKLQRIGVLMLAGWLTLTAGLAIAPHGPSLLAGSSDILPPLWTAFFASLLLITPFIGRAPAALREFLLVAGVSTFAAVVDMALVAVFSVGRVASLTLTLFLALGLYAGARHWLLGRLLGRAPMDMERLFEQLLRSARAIEAQPSSGPDVLVELMSKLYDPIDVQRLPGGEGPARVGGDGAALLLTIPAEIGSPGDGPWTLVLRFAQRGRRLFNSQDARMADSITEQLRRAAAFGQAVEQGRSEERLRLAQDLHDDIGARLLTLMYQAPTPEVEDYVRHTLQDLKTLTRGLAASTHRLSDAGAEWKADLGHRLDSARLQFHWALEFDHDPELGVTAWSALTRVLRELVSNVIAHAQARRVEVVLKLSGGQLTVAVQDDGNGRDPQAWAHGLGLGGVRKRVRQLGGDVVWAEVQPRGIVCRVTVPNLAGPAAPDGGTLESAPLRA